MTATIHTSVDVEIARPPADVWAVVSDYATDSRWRKGITEMTADVAGPPAVDTHVREVLRLAGADYVTDTTVTEVGPSATGSPARDQRRRRGGRRVVAGMIPARPSSPTTSTCSRSAPKMARPVMALVAAPVRSGTCTDCATSSRPARRTPSDRWAPRRWRRRRGASPTSSPPNCSAGAPAADRCAPGAPRGPGARRDHPTPPGRRMVGAGPGAARSASAPSSPCSSSPPTGCRAAWPPPWAPSNPSSPPASPRPVLGERPRARTVVTGRHRAHRSSRSWSCGPAPGSA